jgi:hypothetical protein
LHEQEKTVDNGSPCAAALDSDLTLIRDRWPTLPDAIRAGILAMVRAACPVGASAGDRSADAKCGRSRD